MDKKTLVVVSLCAVVFLVLGSLSNVIGYKTIPLPCQRLENDTVDKNELLNPHFSFKKYRVIGTGDGWWIDLFNATWTIYLYKGYEANDSYTNHT